MFLLRMRLVGFLVYSETNKVSILKLLTIPWQMTNLTVLVFFDTLKKEVMPKRRCHYLTINSANAQFLNIFPV